MERNTIMSYRDVQFWYQDYDDEEPSERELKHPRCPRCKAFVSVKPTARLVEQGPNIVEIETVDCGRCHHRVWGDERVVGSVWPRFDWNTYYQEIEQKPDNTVAYWEPDYINPYDENDVGQ